jgi:flagellar biosynthesis/type III secretory pathway protein FliH
MDERFLSLADILRPQAALAPPQLPPPAVVVMPKAEEIVRGESDEGVHDEIMRDVRLFRARLADALDALRDRLLVALASEVIVRELRVAPVDIDALVRRLVDERVREGPIRVRLAPEDVARVRGVAWTVVADPALLAGDAVLECDGGDVDARLGVRLADVLRELQ